MRLLAGGKDIYYSNLSVPLDPSTKYLTSERRGQGYSHSSDSEESPPGSLNHLKESFNPRHRLAGEGIADIHLDRYG